ncbi:hypothetical protein PspLS_07735 [Pyricularia sp. CBS 133598]|nr:hypothetical protein PspLS_07735 [Pyricularia sp. CBS 133598]
MLRLIRQAGYGADAARRSLGDLADQGGHPSEPGLPGYYEDRIEDVRIGDHHHVHGKKMLWPARRGRVRYWAAERDGLALAQGVGGAARHEQKRHQLRTSSGSSQPISLTASGPRFVCKVPLSDADRRTASEGLLLVLHCISAAPASYFASALPSHRYMPPLVEKLLLRLRLLARRLRSTIVNINLVLPHSISRADVDHDVRGSVVAPLLVEAEVVQHVGRSEAVFPVGMTQAMDGRLGDGVQRDPLGCRVGLEGGHPDAALEVALDCAVGRGGG